MAGPTFTQYDVFQDAETVLVDDAFTRYTPVMLNRFLNAGLREIAFHKPTSVAETAVIPLVAGTRQILPSDYHALIRVHCNVTGTSPNFTRTSTIRMTDRTTMDVSTPNWHDETKLGFTAAAKHAIYDPKADPREFWVYPGNDGTGQIECTVGTTPADLANGNIITDASTYTNLVPLNAVYRQALVDFVIARAFEMDMDLPGRAQRAQYHRQLFASAIGIKTQAELMYSPNAEMPTDRPAAPPGRG